MIGLWELIESDKEIREYGHMRRCCVCGRWFDIDDMERLRDGRWICEDCYALGIRVAIKKGLLKKEE